MTQLYWREFGVIFAAALFGSLALVPYSLRLLSASRLPSVLVYWPEPSFATYDVLGKPQRGILWRNQRGALDAAVWNVDSALASLSNMACADGTTNERRLLDGEWLFWTYGIEAAIIAHFSADIVYRVVGTTFLQHLRSQYQTGHFLAVSARARSLTAPTKGRPA